MLSENPAQTIMIAEDDQALSQLLLRVLQAETFTVEQIFNGSDVLGRLSARVGLLILDLNLPGLDGLGVLHALRPRFPKLPVLVLTARARVESTVLVLEAGADDCLTKPFSCVELLARVRSLLRRQGGEIATVSQCGNLILNRRERRVERGGRRIVLTPREYRLLEYLMRSPRVPVTRADLKENVWGSEPESATNIVDVYMKYLRDKVEVEQPRLIHTVRGVGYVVTDV